MWGLRREKATTHTIAVLILLLLQSSVSYGRSLEEIVGDACIDVDASSTVMLCVFPDEVGIYNSWYVCRQNGQCTYHSDGVGHSLYQLSLSADRKLLAAVGGEEGHPILHVYRLEAFLNKRYSEAVVFVRLVHPGSLGIDGWIGHSLLLQSDQDLKVGWNGGESGNTNCFLLNPYSGLVDEHDCPED